MLTRTSTCISLNLPSEVVCCKCQHRIESAMLKNKKPIKNKQCEKPWLFKWENHRESIKRERFRLSRSLLNCTVILSELEQIKQTKKSSDATNVSWHVLFLLSCSGDAQRLVSKPHRHVKAAVRWWGNTYLCGYILFRSRLMMRHIHARIQSTQMMRHIEQMLTTKITKMLTSTMNGNNKMLENKGAKFVSWERVTHHMVKILMLIFQ